MINIGKLKTAHSKFKAAHHAMVQTELETAARIGQEHPGKHAEFKHRTHKLERSTRGKVIRTAGGRLVKLTNARKYAAAIDSGAKPHIIRARRAKALRFVSGGQVVFRRAVNHPGNRPYKFLWKATFAAYRVAGPNLAAGMARIARRF